MRYISVDSLNFAETLHKTPALVCYRVRCGKPSCHCATGERHGPYWFLHWREGTVQRRRYIRQADVPAVKAIIARRRAGDRAARQHAAQAVTNLRRIRNLIRDIEQKAARCQSPESR